MEGLHIGGNAQRDAETLVQLLSHGSDRLNAAAEFADIAM